MGLCGVGGCHDRGNVLVRVRDVWGLLVDPCAIGADGDGGAAQECPCRGGLRWGRGGWWVVASPVGREHHMTRIVGNGILTVITKRKVENVKLLFG